MELENSEGWPLERLMAVAKTDRPDVFVGQPENYKGIGIYGGHFLGQALAAGFETVEQPKVAASFHAYFLKAGNPELPLIYEVTSLRDGARSDARSITALQAGERVFHMIASFKLPEEGDEHQKEMPQVITAPAIIEERDEKGEERFPYPMMQGGRIEMEFAGPSFREFVPDREDGLRLWLRKTGSAGLNERETQIVLAFLSDATLMFNSGLSYGLPFQSHRMTSLDQSVWFHGACNACDWMLYDQRSVAAADGRGLNEGEFYSSDGKLIMSGAQESMLRRM